LGLVLVLGYFWTDIRDGFTAWFITSDANAQIGLEEETILAWLWLALPAVALLGWLVFGPKKTKGPFQGFSLTGSLWGLLGLAFIVPAVGVILVISLGVGDAISGGKVQNMIDQTFGIEIQREDVDCSLEEFLAANNDIIPFEGGVVTLCPTDGVISFFAAERAEVEVRFQRDFASRNQEVLQTRFPSSFYVVQRGGGLRDSHELFVIETGFISSGLSSIDVFIRSVRP